MPELAARQIADALHKCCGTLVCEGCPYQKHGTPKCIQMMQMAAAAMLDEQDAKISELEQLIAKLRRIIASHKI